MAKNKVTYQIIEGRPNTETFERLAEIYATVFDDADITFFKQRFTEKTDILSVLAFQDKTLIGFKIGYRYNDTTFYSWVGGVLKVYRNQGVAMQLAKLQEETVIKNSYKKLRTKSMNRFKPMMILNLKNRFDIVSVYTNTKNQTKVVFEKLLN